MILEALVGTILGIAVFVIAIFVGVKAEVYLRDHASEVPNWVQYTLIALAVVVIPAICYALGFATMEWLFD